MLYSGDLEGPGGVSIPDSVLYTLYFILNYGIPSKTIWSTIEDH
jgi:hypothetical protein